MKFFWNVLTIKVARFAINQAVRYVIGSGARRTLSCLGRSGDWHTTTLLRVRKPTGTSIQHILNIILPKLPLWSWGSRSTGRREKKGVLLRIIHGVEHRAFSNYNCCDYTRINISSGRLINLLRFEPCSARWLFYYLWRPLATILTQDFVCCTQHFLFFILMHS